MKLERIYSFLNYFFEFKCFFPFNWFINLLNKFFITRFFIWKILNYSDGYWFLYSNKKAIHDLRHLAKTKTKNKN